MRKAHKRRGLGVALILAAAAALAVALAAATPLAARATPLSNATANCTVPAAQVVSAGHSSHLGGIVIAQEGSNCSTANGNGHKPTEPPFNGDPPLLFNGAGGAADCVFSPCEDGNVMMTASTGPLVVVPIFWNPAGYPMSSAYKSLITSYLGDVAKDSGHTKNVFSVLNEYHGNNGQIQYNVQLGPVINDTDPLPASGCTLQPNDTTGIYADGSGYSACLDDLQLQAEVDTVSAASSLPHGLSHIYVLYLPKAVESCFLPGETTSVGPGQFCTINHQPTAAYCAYHSEDPARAVYANLAYPIYQSPVGFTCGSDALEAGFGVVESPNGNPDADVEISPTSHEISEAITDPDTETGWYDAGFNEIGDDCAYIYGKARGAKGAYFNQVINGGHFLTQQEFSNNLFASSGGTAGCLQSEG
jgi:hypothetical protein